MIFSIGPHHRDTFSPDMFTDYESEPEKVPSPPTPLNVGLHDTETSVVLNTRDHEEASCTSSSSKVIRTAVLNLILLKFFTFLQGCEPTNNPSSTQMNCLMTHKTKRNQENANKGNKAIRKSKSKKRRLSSSGANEDDSSKAPKRKRLQRSWAVGDLLSAKPKALSSPKQSNTTNIIQPTFAIRKKKSAQKVRADVSTTSSKKISSKEVMLSSDTGSLRAVLSPPNSGHRSKDIVQIEVINSKEKSKSKIDFSSPASGDFRLCIESLDQTEKNTPSGIVETAIENKRMKLKKSKKSISLTNRNLDDWSTDLVKRILSERTKSK